MHCCRRYGEIVERKLIAISYLNEMKVSKQNISISENGQLEYQKFHRSCAIGWIGHFQFGMKHNKEPCVLLDLFCLYTFGKFQPGTNIILFYVKPFRDGWVWADVVDVLCCKYSTSTMVYSVNISLSQKPISSCPLRIKSHMLVHNMSVNLCKIAHMWSK